MRILQIVPHYIPAYHYGGVQHVSHFLGKHLVRLGHEVAVCTTNLADEDRNLDVPIDEPITLEGVKVYYEPVCLMRYWGFSPRMVRRIWKESCWADVIIIHFHYQFASLIGGFISRIRKKPYVIFTHGSLNRYSVEERSAFRKKCYLTLLESKNFRNAIFTAFHSPEEMENSLKYGQCQVVPNGIDPDEFSSLPKVGYFRERYPETQGRIVYLYLGRLASGKGLDLLMPAFQQLVQRRQDVHLILAGDDERGYASTIRRVIGELKIAKNVTLTGLINGHLKLGALQDADMFVLPSRGEGMSIAMLEAMYMGLPVVVSDRVGLWRQIVERGAGLVVPLEINKLAMALMKVGENQDRRVMGQKGRLLVETKYTWDTIAQNLVEQIQESIG